MNVIITGNGEFLKLGFNSLHIDAVNARFHNKDIFLKYFNFYFNKDNGSFYKKLRVQDSWLKKYIGEITLQDWIFDVINFYKDEMQKTENFEETFGKVLDEILMHNGKPNFKNRFKTLYVIFSLICIAVLFREITMDDKDDFVKRFSYDTLLGRYGSKYNLYTLNYLHEGFGSECFLHGAINPKPWSWTTEQLLETPSEDLDFLFNLYDFMPFIRKDNTYISINKGYQGPPIFGKNIQQKIAITEILYGYTPGDISKKLKGTKEEHSSSKIVLKMFPYHILKSDTKKADTTFLYGINILNHKGIFDWIYSKKIVIFALNEEEKLSFEYVAKDIKKNIEVKLSSEAYGILDMQIT